MTPSFDQPSSASTSQERVGTLPRLFRADLPRLRQSGRPFPELAGASSIDRVLDIASGSGDWAIAAAQADPRLQILGIERDARQIEQARTEAERQGITNISFTQLVPFHPSDLADNSFDLVNARYIVGLLPAAQWPTVLKEFVRVTRPGGVIRLTETDMYITNSAAVEQVSSWICQAYSRKGLSFSPTGRLLSVTPMLKGLLQDAGCQHVQQAVWNTNFSSGMPTYEEVSRDLTQIYRLLLPFIVDAIEGLQHDQVEQTYQRMLDDMRGERFTANVLSLTVWGIKP